MGTEPCRPRCSTCTHATETTAGEMDGRMDGQPWRSKSRGGGRERSERADRERSEHATASCVRRLLRRHQFISDAVCPLCAHSLLSASRGHRHRFSSPPHPSIHPRHTIPSSTTAIQSRINTVTIKASEREEDDHPVKQVRLWRKEPRRGQIWGGLVFFFLKPFRWRRP